TQPPPLPVPAAAHRERSNRRALHLLKCTGTQDVLATAQPPRSEGGNYSRIVAVIAAPRSGAVSPGTRGHSGFPSSLTTTLTNTAPSASPLRMPVRRTAGNDPRPPAPAYPGAGTAKEGRSSRRSASHAVAPR